MCTWGQDFVWKYLCLNTVFSPSDNGRKNSPSEVFWHPHSSQSDWLGYPLFASQDPNNLAFTAHTVLTVGFVLLLLSYNEEGRAWLCISSLSFLKDKISLYSRRWPGTYCRLSIQLMTILLSLPLDHWFYWCAPPCLPPHPVLFLPYGKMLTVVYMFCKWLKEFSPSLQIF